MYNTECTQRHVCVQDFDFASSAKSKELVMEGVNDLDIAVWSEQPPTIN
jgi:hypothetical protein